MQLQELAQLFTAHALDAELEGFSLARKLAPAHVIDVSRSEELDFRPDVWAAAQPASVWDEFQLPGPHTAFMAGDALIVLWDYHRDAVGLAAPRGVAYALWLDEAAAAPFEDGARRVLPSLADRPLAGFGLVCWNRICNGQVIGAQVALESQPGGVLIATQDECLLYEQHLDAANRQGLLGQTPEQRFALVLSKHAALLSQFAIVYLAYINTLGSTEG